MARDNQGYTPYYNNNDFRSPNHNYDEDFINVSQVSHAPSFRRPQLSKQDKEATENFKTQKKLETKKWNVFEETGDNDKSVSERKYDRSLLKKYKILKVNHAFYPQCAFTHFLIPGIDNVYHLLSDFDSRSSSKRCYFLHGQPNWKTCHSKSLSRKFWIFQLQH